MLKISRILHAGYIFEKDGTSIVFDPLFENPFSQNCYAFPSVEFDVQTVSSLKFDAIFISHYHDDHFSLESLNLLDRHIPIYMFSVHQELFRILENLGFSKVYSISLNQKIVIGPFQLVPLEALDSDVDSLFHIRVDDLNILNVVDSWIGLQTMDYLQTVGSWDLVLWPFQNMREIEVISLQGLAAQAEIPFELMDQLKQLNPRYLIPSSCQFQFEEWSWYNQVFFPMSYIQFQKEVESALPEVNVLRLDPGEILYCKNAKFEKHGRLSWIQPVGDQKVDYMFDPNVIPQSLSTIAKNLSSIDQNQKKLIHEFCMNDILKRYSELDHDENSFFNKEQFWSLVIYSSSGEAQKYLYRINQFKMEKVDQNKKTTWVTEIPEIKLYKAVFEGESLTSLYIRVQPESSSVDPLIDPLIRVLYEGKIGSYQLAQLEKIKSRNLF